MNLVFLAGTLEPRLSGVADYILALSSKLTTLGIQCSCIAINDTLLPNASPILRSYDNGVSIIRIPSFLPWKTKFLLLEEELMYFKPDWISLQYVPYSFHPKGLSFRLPFYLWRIKKYARMHIMVHELWISGEGGFLRYIIHVLQRQLALFTFRSLSPSLLQTTNFWYSYLLTRNGLCPSILPLFSSIPVHNDAAPLSNRSQVWTFVSFGSIHEHWNPEPLLSQIELARKHYCIESCHFVSVGNTGDYGARLWDSLQNLSYPHFLFTRIGQVPSHTVSRYLKYADFGISMVPSHLIDKSSSAIAMLAHGLPIIISRISPGFNDWHQILRRSHQYILLDKNFVESMGVTHEVVYQNNVDSVASQFIKGLNSSGLA